MSKIQFENELLPDVKKHLEVDTDLIKRVIKMEQPNTIEEVLKAIMLKEGIKLYRLEVIQDPNTTTDLEYITRYSEITETVLKNLGFSRVRTIETETFKRVETLWVSPINPDSRKIYVSMVDNVEIYMKEFKELLNSVPQFISDNFKLTS